MMREDIKLIDLVIELVDSRAPLSSRNPDIDKLAGSKSRMILLNKSDLADEDVNSAWYRYFFDKGYTVVKLNSKSGAGIKNVSPSIQEACRKKLERDRQKGIKNRPVRAMVVGIPNVGKSTFINSLAGKAAAKTGNKPGVTKGRQWIRLNKDVELLDTPGVLWPKIEDPETGKRLAFIGSINDEIIEKRELACELIDFLKDEEKGYAGLVGERYAISEDKPSHEILSDIAIARKCLIKGGEPDIDRAAGMLIDDFRSARIGRISLERP
jgi:ribosome biogenesis GTPase A